MPDKIKNDVIVSLQYSLSLDDGSLVESSEPDDPLMYLHGHDNIIPGLERELEGLQVGNSKSIVVEPEDAYGEYDPEEIDMLDRDEIPPELEPHIGMLLSIEDEDGSVFIARVDEITDDTISLDFNHPLAGQRLHFEVTITDIREATQEELDHGHVHGDHDHHH